MIHILLYYSVCRVPTEPIFFSDLRDLWPCWGIAFLTYFSIFVCGVVPGHTKTSDLRDLGYFFICLVGWLGWALALALATP